ncbi:MAG: DNA repair protein RadC, partial [Anaerovoracaceae bacterium]
MKLKELAISERPRERMIAQGREMLSNSELLAILIRTGTRDRTAIGLGEDLLSLGKEGLVYLEGCSLEELSRVKGIGMAKACQISAAIELGKRMATCPRTKRIAISGTADVVSLFMERMRYYKKEYFNTLLVNAKGEVICNETVSIGDLSSSIVHPRETFTEAVKRCAYGVILVHNH